MEFVVQSFRRQLAVRGAPGLGSGLAAAGSTWWGEAPERLYDFDEAAGMLNQAFQYSNTLADLSDAAR